MTELTRSLKRLANLISDEVHEVVYLEREDIAFEQDVIGHEDSNQIQEYK